MAQPAGGGNLLTRKYGPAPGWAWVGIAALGTALWLRHRNNTTSPDTSAETDTATENAAYDSAAADELQDTGPAPNADYADPYTGAGQLYTDLAAAQAREQTQAEQLSAEARRLRTYRRNHPAGAVNKRTRVYTAHARETLRAIASRFGVTVTELRKANPHLGKRSVIAKGERLHIPTVKPKAKQ